MTQRLINDFETSRIFNYPYGNSIYGNSIYGNPYGNIYDPIIPYNPYTFGNIIYGDSFFNNRRFRRHSGRRSDRRRSDRRRSCGSGYGYRSNYRRSFY